MRRWEALVDKYLSGFRAKGLTESYLKNTRRELERMGGWLKRRRPRPKLEDVSFDMLIDYIKSRSPFRAKSTVYAIVSKVRGMGNFLVREAVWQQNPLRWIHGPRIDHRSRLPRRIRQKDIEKLLVEAAKTHVQHQRYLKVAMIMLLYSTGLRRGELERLDVSDWDNQRGIIRIDGRKTGSERSVPVPEGVAGAIEAYLVRRHNLLEKVCNLSEEALFINRNGVRMKATSIGRSLHKLARRAGVPLVTLHQFRHTCASDLLEGGTCLPDVQKILGHRHIDSTMRYSHIADPERRKAIERHPINRMLSQEAV